MMEGFATPEATCEVARSHPGMAYRTVGTTGLTTSQAGFGCYRVTVEVPRHQHAMEKALTGGINLVDTSIKEQLAIGVVLKHHWRNPDRAAAEPLSQRAVCAGKNIEGVPASLISCRSGPRWHRKRALRPLPAWQPVLEVPPEQPS